MCLVVLVVFSKCHHAAYYHLVEACHAGFISHTTPPAPIPRGEPSPHNHDQRSNDDDTTPDSTTTITINSCALNNNEPLPTFRRTRIPYCTACIAVEENKLLHQYESEINATLASLRDTKLDCQEMYGVGYVSVKRLERKMRRELEEWWGEARVPVSGKRRFVARVGERAKLAVFYQEAFAGM